jgi:hypothetical protein
MRKLWIWLHYWVVQRHVNEALQLLELHLAENNNKYIN